MSAKRRRSFRPLLESLENRCVPATLTVTNRNDAGLGSLRQAVLKANMAPAADTIVFKPGMEGTILLTTGEIAITGNLVIAGPGAGKITIDGNANGRIFNVSDNNLNTFKNVTIKGLTLFNGSNSLGGAIESTENLTLVKTVITGNEAATGGSIHSYTGKLTIRGSTIQGNEATGLAGGGGIFLDAGEALIVASQILNNRAQVDGGGIFVTNSAKLTLQKVTLSGNASGDSGAGLFANNSAGPLVIKNSTVTGNRADVTGGGMYSACILTLTKSKITFNTAQKNAGGIATLSDAAIDHCVISGNTCLGNPADGLGGGIAHNNGYLSITDSTISGNTAKLHGGGVFVAATTESSRIRGCTITGNTTVSGDGGGIASEQNDLVVERCVINANSALDGVGGGISQKNKHVELYTSTISGNRAKFNGGGVYLGSLAFDSRIRGCTLAGNSAGAGGGGVFVDSSVQVLQIQNSTISGNRATLQGGAIFLVNSALTKVQNSTLAFNEAGSVGGGIWLGAGDLDLDSSIVAQNSAPASPDLYSAGAGSDFNVTVSLIGSTAGANVPSPDATTTALLGKDPLLAPLANNGGPTQTHALKKGSPAINKGSNPATMQFDQRGAPFKRQLGPAVDIGAFETQ